MWDRVIPTFYQEKTKKKKKKEPKSQKREQEKIANQIGSHKRRPSASVKQTFQTLRIGTHAPRFSYFPASGGSLMSVPPHTSPPSTEAEPPDAEAESLIDHYKYREVLTISRSFSAN